MNDATITNTLRSSFPLAVYSVEKVLLPNDLFGVKAPASAPTPVPAGKTPKAASEAPSEAGTATTTDSSAAVVTKRSSLAALGLVGVTLGALL